MLNNLLAGVGQFLAEQVAGQVAALGLVAALAAVGGFLLGYLLQQRPDLKDELQVVADHSEAIEAFATRVAVIAAEKFGIEANKFGYDKAVFASDVLQAALASVGIRGDASKVNWSESFKAIRETAARLFPVHSRKVEPPDVAA